MWIHIRKGKSFFNLDQGTEKLFLDSAHPTATNKSSSSNSQTEKYIKSTVASFSRTSLQGKDITRHTGEQSYMDIANKLRKECP